MTYTIEGDTLPVVICTLEAGESMFTESGAMSWMTPNMQMKTAAGGVGKALGRMFSGESLFLNHYSCQSGQGLIAFASRFPGRILAMPISPEQSIVVQKSAFLAAQPTVELAVKFNRKIGAGLFGGEGFIMQRLSGQGLAFLELDGHIVEYDLQAGQSMLVDTGHIAAMTDSVAMDIETVPGLKNKFLGGEGWFHTRVTGPGHVWIQTMPLNKISSMFISTPR